VRDRKRERESDYSFTQSCSQAPVEVMVNDTLRPLYSTERNAASILHEVGYASDLAGKQARKENLPQSVFRLQTLKLPALSESLYRIP